jgi:TolB-like protein
MSRFSNFYGQLRKRRVIRTAVVYAALVWGSLQVADLLADARFISDALVQGLIIAALVGFPLTLMLSWFFEAPWRQRKGLSVFGDVAVILAIAIGVFLVAWQQYFVSFTRPTLAITLIEATDARADSEALGPYLAGRIRMALATRPELAVSELSSSLRPQLERLGAAEKARALAADFILSGTLNQGPGVLRVSLQLYDGEGELVWSEGFEDRLLDLGELEVRILHALWAELPLPAEALAATQGLMADCEYPPQAEAIRELVRAEDGQLEPDLAVARLTELIEQHEDNGLLLMARARAYFTQREDAAPPRKPVLNNLGLQDLKRLSDRCPGFPVGALLVLHNNRMALLKTAEIQSRLASFPNDAILLLALAEAWHREGDEEKSAAILREAWRLDPLGADTICSVVERFRATGDIRSADEYLAHALEFVPGDTLVCGSTLVLR